MITLSSYPKRVEEIKSHFVDKEKLDNLLLGLEQMEEAHNNTDGGVMRFRYHNPTKTLKQLKGFINKPIEFMANADFKRIEPTFITEDELDSIYKSSNQNINKSNIDTYAIFKQGHSQKDKSDYLKNRYGLSGTGISNINYSHSGKGTELRKSDISKPYAEVLENWGQVAKRVDRLINENRYLNKAEIDYIPTYEKELVARSILTFYNYAPTDTEKPFGKEETFSYNRSNYDNSIGELVEKLDDKVFVGNLVEIMENAVSHTLSDEHWSFATQTARAGNQRGFNSMESALDKVKQLQNGTYSIFNKVVLSKRESSIDDEDLDDTDEEVSIEKLAKKIERKRNISNEQLTLDFFNTDTTNNEVSTLLEEKGLMVSDELIEYAKEDLDNPSPSEIAEKVEGIIAEDEKSVETNVRNIMYSDIADMFIQNRPNFKDYEMSLYTNDEGKEFVFGYGSKGRMHDPSSKSKIYDQGNGTTVWNFLEEVDGDYKTVGHISETGVVNWLDNEMPDNAKAEIHRRAKVFSKKDNNITLSENVEQPLQTEKAIDEYLRVKSENVSDVIGVIADNKISFYGEDAKIVAPALNIKVIERDIDVLGYTSIVSDDISNLENSITNLCESGVDFKLIKDGNIVRENKAKDYIPLGMEIDINGRKFEIDSVNYDYNEVSLKDVTFRNNTGFPIFRSERINFVRQFVEGKQALEKPIENEVKANIEISKKTDEITVDTIDYDFDNQATLPTFEKQKEVVNEINTPRIDFKINDNDLGVGTPKEKFSHNINAIKTVQLIESEKRLATPEEQEILSKYVGWGGLADAFDDSKTNWNNEYQTLKGLLSDDEYKSARASTLNAHYTPPIVINSMYEALEQMGIPKDVNIIDPALGTGHFMGMLPDSLKGSNFYGAELDSLTGRIAKQLYQNSDIQIKGFEKASFSDNFFDVAVGNVPFGNYKLNDRRYDKQNFLIHDYFFAKTLDKVRVGGVLAFITSKGTLDKQSDEVRKYLAQRADLLGAIRLPNTAFKANAGTEVTSDIIFLQKRGTPTRAVHKVNDQGDHAPEIMPD